MGGNVATLKMSEKTDSIWETANMEIMDGTLMDPHMDAESVMASLSSSVNDAFIDQTANIPNIRVTRSQIKKKRKFNKESTRKFQIEGYYLSEKSDAGECLVDAVCISEKGSVFNLSSASTYHSKGDVSESWGVGEDMRAFQPLTYLHANPTLIIGCPISYTQRDIYPDFNVTEGGFILSHKLHISSVIGKSINNLDDIEDGLIRLIGMDKGGQPNVKIYIHNGTSLQREDDYFYVVVMANVFIKALTPLKANSNCFSLS